MQLKGNNHYLKEGDLSQIYFHICLVKYIKELSLFLYLNQFLPFCFLVKTVFLWMKWLMTKLELL